MTVHSDAIDHAVRRMQQSRVLVEDIVDSYLAACRMHKCKIVSREPSEAMLIDGACCFPETPEDQKADSIYEPGASTMREDAISTWQGMWDEARSPSEEEWSE